MANVIKLRKGLDINLVCEQGLPRGEVCLTSER